MGKVHRAIKAGFVPLNQPAPIRGVIFDIDGTLSPVVSWLELTTALGASVDEHRRIFEDYRSQRISYEESRVQLIGLWRSTGRANRQEFSRIVGSWPLDAAAAPLVAELLSRGAKVGIITGSFDLYAQILARRLGVSHWYANTRLVFDAQDNLVSYDYIRDQAAQKLVSCKQFLTDTGLAAPDCAAIGDGPNDELIFQATGRGIFIDHQRSGDDTTQVRAAAWRVLPSLADAADVLLPNMRYDG